MNETGQPVDGATMTVALGDDQRVSAQAISAGGQVQFQNLPDRTFAIQASAGARFGSVPTIGSAGTVTLKIAPIGAPSPIKNDDFSLGVDGWNIGSAPVSLIPHVEQGPAAAAMLNPLGAPAGRSSPPPSPALNLGPLAPPQKQDLRLSTSGEGQQMISRTFITDPGTQSVSVRYRFITSEVPGGYYGSKYNDFFTVTVRSSAGQTISSGDSMNGLSLAAFDAGGATAWRQATLTLEVGANGQPATIEIAVSVANVGDGAYDSQMVIEAVQQKKIAIKGVKLFDIDKGPLEALSMSPHPYLEGFTQVFRRIAINGPQDDELSEVKLEALLGSRVVATAQLSTGAAQVLLKPFGPSGQVAIAETQLLFKFRASDFSRVDQKTNSRMLLRIKATTKKGESAALDLFSVEKLVQFAGTNRFGKRDETEGGDDWARPSTAAFVSGISGVPWNDFANMNAGHFVDHESHDDGRDADGWFEGFNARNADVARKLIDLLNGLWSLSRVQVVYVTYSAHDGNVFYDAIKAVSLKNGRRAKDVIRPLGGHEGHFHIRVR